MFEREEKAGGMLTYGIVPSRLPQAVVDHDIAMLKGLGIKIELGKKVTEKDLKDFDAVFVGTGLWGTKLPDIPGTDLKGVYTAVDFLKKATEKKEKFNFGKKVVVVGGGDVTTDCAVTAKLLGAEDVRIVYRRTLEEAPGNINEFHYALSLGIGITTNMAPASLEGKGKLSVANFKGRDGKSALSLNCDCIVFAIGQRPEELKAVSNLKTDEKGFVKANAKGKVASNIFSAGDIVNGGKTVVEAVADGKEAAKAIVAYLEKKGVK